MTRRWFALSLSISLVWLAGCGARSYVPSEARRNLNAGLGGVLLERVGEGCEMAVSVKGDAGRFVWHPPLALCAQAAVAIGAIATVPVQPPAPPPVAGN